MNRKHFTGVMLVLILTAVLLVFLVPTVSAIVLITLVVNGIILIAVNRRSNEIFKS